MNTFAEVQRRIKARIASRPSPKMLEAFVHKEGEKLIRERVLASFKRAGVTIKP